MPTQVMPSDLAIVLLLLLAAMIMFVRNKPRSDVVALIMIAALPLTGILTVEEALAGFADRNVVLVALIFVIGESLVRTGVAQRVGDWLVERSGNSEARLIILLMLLIGSFGAFMSSTGVVAIFIPVVLRVCQNAGMAPGRLMMPLAFAALISGMMTLVATTPNLMVQSELVRRGLEGFNLFSFTPFGVPVLLLCIVYMLFARRFLGRKQSADDARPRPRLSNWVEEYALNGREARLRILPASSLIGRSLAELNLRSTTGIILSIERSRTFGRKLVMPQAETRLLEGDIILMDISTFPDNPEEVCARHGLELLPLSGAYFTDRSQEMGMVEVIIPASSDLIDKTVTEAQFRNHYGLVVIGIKRGMTALQGCIIDKKIQLGDTLLLIGSWRAIRNLRKEFDNLVLLDLPEEFDQVIPIPAKAPHAFAVLALVVFLMATGIVPNVLAALIGCLLLGLFRCITLETAYRSIRWQSLILIVGMLPFALALQKTGGISMAADALIDLIGEKSPRTVLACIFGVTALFGLFVSNTATAVLMTPIALAVATGMKASPYPFAMTVALAASSAFMSPVSSPVNTLVLGPGNYKFSDFIRIGMPMTVITLIVTILLVPVLMPF